MATATQTKELKERIVEFMSDGRCTRPDILSERMEKPIAEIVECLLDDSTFGKKQGGWYHLLDKGVEAESDQPARRSMAFDVRDVKATLSQLFWSLAEGRNDDDTMDSELSMKIEDTFCISVPNQCNVGEALDMVINTAKDSLTGKPQDSPLFVTNKQLQDALNVLKGLTEAGYRAVCAALAGVEFEQKDLDKAYRMLNGSIATRQHAQSIKWQIEHRKG